MFTKFLDRKVVIFLSFFMSICGILGQLLPQDIGDLRFFLQTFSVANLSFLGRADMFNGHESQIYYNYFNGAFFFIFLAGAILHALRGEKRILLFCFSIIFGVLCIGLLNTPFDLLAYIKFLKSPYYLLLVYRIALAIWLFKFLKTHQQQTDIKQYSENVVEGYDRIVVESARRTQRFMHNLVDYIIACLVFFPWIEHFMRVSPKFATSINSFSREIGERSALVLFALIFRIIYYLFFEGIFNSSPAKYLTATRIVSEEGENVGFGRVLGRTFARFIPFEPLSFLGSGARGWHDTFTSTQAAPEKEIVIAKTSANWLLPLTIGFAVFSYWGIEKYDKILAGKERNFVKSIQDDYQQKRANLGDTTNVLEFNLESIHESEASSLVTGKKLMIFNKANSLTIESTEMPRNWTIDIPVPLNIEPQQSYFFPIQNYEFRKETEIFVNTNQNGKKLRYRLIVHRDRILTTIAP